MAYENTQYWTDIHRAHSGQLKAVGYPFLSEAFNALKYQSEAESLAKVLKITVEAFQSREQRTLSVLDVGAGIGYWTEVVKGTLSASGFSSQHTALDISEEALAKVKQKDPSVQVVRADLKTIPSNKFNEQFDLVYAFYCLHHLKRHDDFLNALHFVAASVKKDGFLILMDPMLHLPFSLGYSLNFATYNGNGVMRPLYLLDDVLERQGFSRVGQTPAVSFLLNGNAEAYGFFGYALLKLVWKIFGLLVYRSENLTRLISPVLVGADRFLKGAHLGFSSKICLYRKS